MPSMSTSMPGGMFVASASTAIWISCWSSRPSGATSPVTVTGISTVTFSPRRTMIRSTCSTEPLMASRCTALGSASWLPPGRPSSRISTFAVRSASSTSWPGRLTCRGSVPCPYRTAGTRPARRSLRAGPLPNSVRGSAAMRTSGTVVLLNKRQGEPRRSVAENRGRRRHASLPEPRAGLLAPPEEAAAAARLPPLQHPPSATPRRDRDYVSSATELGYLDSAGRLPRLPAADQASSACFGSALGLVLVALVLWLFSCSFPFVSWLT